MIQGPSLAHLTHRQGRRSKYVEYLNVQKTQDGICFGDCDTW